MQRAGGLADLKDLPYTIRTDNLYRWHGGVVSDGQDVKDRSPHRPRARGPLEAGRQPDKPDPYRLRPRRRRAARQRSRRRSQYHRRALNLLRRAPPRPRRPAPVERGDAQGGAPESAARRAEVSEAHFVSQHLQSDHNLDSFDSGQPALDEWLRASALHAESIRSGRTWVWTEIGR